jgi:hypothetical protein
MKKVLCAVGIVWCLLASSVGAMEEDGSGDGPVQVQCERDPALDFTASGASRASVSEPAKGLNVRQNRGRRGVCSRLSSRLPSALGKKRTPEACISVHDEADADLERIMRRRSDESEVTLYWPDGREIHVEQDVLARMSGLFGQMGPAFGCDGLIDNPSVTITDPAVDFDAMQYLVERMKQQHKTIVSHAQAGTLSHDVINRVVQDERNYNAKQEKSRAFLKKVRAIADKYMVPLTLWALGSCFSHDSVESAFLSCMLPLELLGLKTQDWAVTLIHDAIFETCGVRQRPLDRIAQKIIEEPEWFFHLPEGHVIRQKVQEVVEQEIAGMSGGVETLSPEWNARAIIFNVSCCRSFFDRYTLSKFQEMIKEWVTTKRVMHWRPYDSSEKVMRASFAIFRLLRVQELEFFLHESVEHLEDMGTLNSLKALLICNKSKHPTLVLELPESLRGMKQLKRLWLYDCKIPEWIGELENLENLGIWNYHHWGRVLPESMQCLTKLRNLTLVRFKLRSLPDWVGQLSSLESLTVFGNLLKTLPDSLSQCQHLCELDLSDNRLVVIPRCIHDLTELRTLNLSQNRLNYIPGSLFEGHKKLTHLDVSCNLHARVDDMFFVHLGGLTQFNYSGCSHLALPYLFWQHENLKSCFLGSDYQNLKDIEGALKKRWIRGKKTFFVSRYGHWISDLQLLARDYPPELGSVSIICDSSE